MSERARVGLIIPSSNRRVEQERARFFPQDASPHVARLRMTGSASRRAHGGREAGVLKRWRVPARRA